MRDEKLLHMLSSDPERGMGELISAYSGLVYSVIRARLGRNAFSEADIEDCAAETFAEFYFSLGSFDPKRCSIKTWLCVLAGNNAKDALRKRKRAPETLSIDEEGSIELPGPDFTEDEALKRALCAELTEAISSLNDTDRQIIVRKFYLGQSSAQIAEKLSLTVSNVDTRTHRAIKKLKERLGVI